MTTPNLAGIYARRASLLRQVAAIDDELAGALQAQQEPPQESDVVLTLAEAASFMGEPASTFRRRLEYAKALVSRPGERRNRYSGSALERIKRDRLAASAVA